MLQQGSKKMTKHLRPSFISSLAARILPNEHRELQERLHDMIDDVSTQIIPGELSDNIIIPRTRDMTDAFLHLNNSPSCCPTSY
jgi:hypothetical protein